MKSIPTLPVTIELLRENAQMPARANPSDACFDLKAAQSAVVENLSTSIVGLGFSMQLSLGWEAQVRGRSGLASRGIVVHPGTIDHLYRQEIKVILHNLSGQPFEIQVGDRIAQMTFAPVYPVDLISGSVELTARGGLGSTGV